MRYLKMLFVVIFCVALQGCVYWKLTTLKIKGDEVRAPIASYTPIEGKGIKAWIIRQVWWTNETGRKAPNLSNIKIADDADGGGIEIERK